MLENIYNVSKVVYNISKFATIALIFVSLFFDFVAKRKPSSSEFCKAAVVMKRIAVFALFVFGVLLIIRIVGSFFVMVI